MSTVTLLADAWWGFAEADPTVVGIVVAAVGALALVYLVMRLSARRDREK